MNKTIRSLLCLLLALAMALSLAACGGKSGENNEKETPNEETASSELVYSASFLPVKTSADGYLDTKAFTQDGFYASTYEVIGTRELREGEELEYDGQLDVYGEKLFFVSYDGQVRSLDQYKPMEAREDTEGRLNFDSGSALDGLAVNADGKLVTVERIYTNWFDGTEAELQSDSSWEKWHYELEYFLRTLEPDGSEISRVPIEYKPDEDGSLMFTNPYVDEAGNVLGTCDMTVIAVAPDGSTAYALESDDYLGSIVRVRDGGAGVVRWGNNGMEFIRIDTEKGNWGEKIALPANAYDLMPGGGGYDVLYRSGSNLYGFNFETGTEEKILNWINCDVNGDYIRSLSIQPDGTVRGLLSRWRDSGSENEVVTLNLVPADSLPKKQTLQMAVMYLDYSMSDRIIDFNRSSDSVRIELQDYSEYNTEEDYSAGLTKLTTEILSGKIPDLLSLSGLPYSQLAAKGLLEDLYPYLDKDNELDREQFFPNELHAMEYNGGLYRICPSFSISSLIGAASVVGDKPGWTYEQFREALASMPEGCTPLDQYTTRDDILNNLIMLDMDDFVDWSTGKCSFDSQEFIDILQFANSFQADFDWENYDWTEDESTQNRIAQGKQMLMNAGVWSMDDIVYNDVYFGGNSTYIGWPTNNGIGNMITLSNDSYAMSASCADKDAGWQFLRSMLGDEYQRGIYGMPVSKKIFDEKLKEAMTPEYRKDENGNILLDENGEKIEESRGGIGFGDGSVYEIYAMTQEQADKLLELINTTTKVGGINESISAIVAEQAQAFFAGDKSAEEVARLVQSKVNIYVNEQR